MVDYPAGLPLRGRRTCRWMRQVCNGISRRKTASNMGIKHHSWK